MAHRTLLSDPAWRRPQRLPVQLELRPRTHGGKREGAGRPKTGNAGVPHRSREALASRFPVHVTLRAHRDAPDLRGPKSLDALHASMEAGHDRFGFRLVHYSVQPGHVHMICEARDAVALSRGVRGLVIRMARALNRAHGRKGKVWADRYHSRILRTPREIRSCIVYVIGNWRHHGGERYPVGCLDIATSVAYFDGFREKVPGPPPGLPVPVSPPATWLLSKGWKRNGLISIAEGAWAKDGRATKAGRRAERR